MNSFSHSNKQLFIIYKKTEKLTKAVYMITDFFDNKESLKWRLRDRSTSFLSFISTVVHRKGKHSGEELGALIEELFTLLELGRSVQLISFMNFSILREEYRLLLNAFYVQLENRGYINDFEFPERFFSIDLLTNGTKKEREGNKKTAEYNGLKNTPKNNELLVKNKTSLPSSEDRLTSEPTTHLGENKKTSLHHPVNQIENKGFYENKIYSTKKDLRREIILKILRTKGEITINDISYLIEGVGEKTIQRELLSLVDEGIVKREGERRWSKYTLA